MSRPKVAVVGAGYWGPNIIRNCAEMGVLAMVCDLDDHALDVVRRKHPRTRTTRDFGDLLAAPDVDGIIIAAPAHLHAPMALQALAAGKHVLVEKPLALSVEDGQAVVEAGEAAGRIVMVGHLLLYHPGVRRLRELVAQGAIGDVWHVRSRRLSLGKIRQHESVWWSFAPHDVALAIALFGGEPIDVRAAHSGFNSPGVWDVAYADFLFEEGRSAHLEAGWFDPHKTHRLDVFGDAGVLTLEDSCNGPELSLAQCKVYADEPPPRVWRGPEERVDVAVAEPLRTEIDAFLDAMATGRPPETDARHGLAVLRALHIADEDALQALRRTEVMA